MRLVIDTSVMVAAMRSPRGASARVLRQVVEGKHAMIVTQALFLEYEAVLTRPVHVAAAGLSIQRVLEMLDDLVDLAEPVLTHYSWRGMLRGQDDDMVLEAAVAGGADAIVTFSRRDFGPAANFGVGVLLPSEVLERN